MLRVPKLSRRAAPGPNPAQLLDEAVLARLVQQGIRDLAGHSGAYAAVCANKPGVRLAHYVAIGYVGQLSDSGRDALADLYRLTQAALTVEPGLDTNTFVDRVTGRLDPRRDQASAKTSTRWSFEAESSLPRSSPG